MGISEHQIEVTQHRIVYVTTTSMDAYNYFLRGREDFEKFYYDDARKFLEKAVELDSTFAMAYLYLAYTYADMGDYEKAFKYFERYASVLPGDANPFDSMAELYFRMGKLDEDENRKGK